MPIMPGIGLSRDTSFVSRELRAPIPGSDITVSKDFVFTKK
jgi:hypothetical protein